ncbi:uncharacterized protein J3D65DRAFT_11870 [Phyllosticta citribraziliensis]|uniref:Uncharacterized protein n=1 Tax=Phyllosticta citribraziliensis TaxID=989973 RepID=A0ABR1M8R4_9PEZI
MSHWTHLLQALYTAPGLSPSIHFFYACPEFLCHSFWGLVTSSLDHLISSTMTQVFNIDHFLFSFPALACTVACLQNNLVVVAANQINGKSQIRVASIRGKRRCRRIRVLWRTVRTASLVRRMDCLSPRPEGSKFEPLDPRSQPQHKISLVDLV